MTRTYAATVTREGRWWMVAVPEIDGLTQARRIDEAELMARELIAVTLDVPLEDVAVTVTVESVGNVPVRSIVDRIESDRRKAAELEREASRQAVQLAKQLAAENVTMRDVGSILHVSYQRAHQLSTTETRPVGAEKKASA
ncbi:hypothetical protein [Subtercola sp. RTI3]|uniref:type II toxin-antitoxin system HicB family antitoxin n=1 Tax=Subtercola sp. RTI3 TaxID=3048639 RepID=UPI002B23E35E|nr:hypothetical protein [Subtercola sp. RTI3]MEA9986090.1 hypothetical protein [Subtercola sp. RTI3]